MQHSGEAGDQLLLEDGVAVEWLNQISWFYFLF